MKVSVQERPLDVLREYVGWVVDSGNFLEMEIACPESILYPEIGGRQMPDLPEAPAATDADGRRGIGPNGDGPFEAQVGGDRREPQ